MVLRSSIAGFAALLVSLGAVPLADAAPRAKAKAKAVSVPEAEPQSTPAESAPPVAPAPEPAPTPAPTAFVPEQSGVISPSDPQPAPPPRKEMVKPINAPLWGGAFRARWISVPHNFFGIKFLKFLDGFTRANRSVSSYGIGIEGIRRKYDPEDRNRMSEISLAVGYQDMSPRDGNWLGNGKTAAVDTDWVQFKNFGFWTIDFSYLFRQYFNDVVGIHYGGGLGLAIIQGDVLRTSSWGCTADNLSTCRPRCNGHACTEAELKDSEKNTTGYPESPDNPHRFREGSIPSIIPLINAVVGFDFRIPTVPGLEFRAEGGFYNAFFLGGGVAYVH